MDGDVTGVAEESWEIGVIPEMSKSDDADNNSSNNSPDVTESTAVPETGKVETLNSAAVTDNDALPVMKVMKRLGVGRPQKKKLILKISLKDIQKDLGSKLDETSSFTVNRDNEDKVTRIVGYGCNKCTKSFFTVDGYETHMLHAHKIRKIDKYPPSVIKRNVGYPTSPSNSEDGQVAPKEEPEVKPHKDFKHVALKSNFTCDECDAKFVYQQAYDNHVNDHLSRVRKFKCSECPEAFFFEAGLRHHSDSHSKQRKLNSEVYREEIPRGRQPTKSSSKGKRKRSLNSAAHNRPQPAEEEYPKRFKGKLIRMPADMISSEDSEAKKDRQEGMAALTRYKEKKKSKSGKQKEKEIEEISQNGDGKKIIKMRSQQLRELEAFHKKVGIPNIGRLKGDPPPGERAKPEVVSDGKPKRLTRSTYEELKKLEESKKSNVSEDHGVKKSEDEIKKTLKEIREKSNDSNKEKGKKSEEIPLQKDGQKKSDIQSVDSDSQKKGQNKGQKSESSKGGGKTINLASVEEGQEVSSTPGDDGSNLKEKTSKKSDISQKGQENKNGSDGTSKRKKDEREDVPVEKKKKRKESGERSTGRKLRSGTVNSVDDPDTFNVYVSNSEYLEESVDDGFKCHKCNKMFSLNNKFKDHKHTCTKFKKKWTCPKCPKGFTQKTLLDQHYDYYHTKKPKKFVCKPCNKDFPLQKSYLEHNRCLHNDGDYKFVCDLCSHGFFVKGEYTCHRISQTKIKPYACDLCKEASFGTPGRLNAYLERCGKEPSHECSRCGKKFASKQSIEKHVVEHHNNKVTWACPLCEGSVYSSKGGYYKHLQKSHGLTHGGKKLEKKIIKREVEIMEQENDSQNNDEAASNVE